MSGGWERLESSDWLDIAEHLPHPWPESAVRQDLRYWAGQRRLWQQTAGRSGVETRPGRPALCKRWGWNEKKARLFLADVARWADPLHGDPEPSRAQGPAKGQPGASQGPETGAEVRETTEPRGQPGASEGPAKGPTRVEAQDTGHRAPELGGDPILEDPPITVEQGSTPDPDPAEPQQPKPEAPHWTAELWSQLQAIRTEHQPGARGQGLTPKRRANLQSRCRELRQAGLTRDDLLRAARWVHESANIRAEGARSTGDPLAVLLRPAHCVEYCELAEQEQRAGPVAAPERAAARGPASSTGPDPAEAAWTTLQHNLLSGPACLDSAPPAVRHALDAAGGYRQLSAITHDADRARFRSAFLTAYRREVAA